MAANITPLQRQALAWAARPPGPPSFWYAVGTALREFGAKIDAFGTSVMAESATVEKLPIPTTAVKLGGKAPAVGGASFVAPSANLIGSVIMGEGTSAWYGSMLKGSTEIGELSSVGDRAVVVDSVVGKCVHIGAGAIVTGAKLGDESSVGMGCVVGKGASLGAGSALAAGAVLPAGGKVPPGELWGGSPAAKVSALGAEAAAGTVATCEVTAALAKIHMEEAWKELSLVEQESSDYKREKYRTPDRLASMRADPKWIPMPSLGEHLTKIGVHSNTYVPP